MRLRMAQEGTALPWKGPGLLGRGETLEHSPESEGQVQPWGRENQALAGAN